ncbi:MAG: hypothetical protein AABW59_05575 [archaeon]
MNWVRFGLAIIVGGMLISIISMLFSNITTAVSPYDVLSLGGIRSITDPIMILYFAYPFVLAFMMVLAYEYLKDAFRGSANRKAFMLAAVTFMLAEIPSAFMVFASMDYPLGFYVDGVIGGFLYMLVAAKAIVWVIDGRTAKSSASAVKHQIGIKRKK